MSLPPAGFLDSLPPVCNVLRDYQHAALARLRDTLAAGYRRPLVQAPTGAGKTHLIAAVTAAACQAGLRVLILATRSRLVRAAALNPRTTVQRTVVDYLESMRAQVTAHERTWQELNAKAVRS